MLHSFIGDLVDIKLRVAISPVFDFAGEMDIVTHLMAVQLASAHKKLPLITVVRCRSVSSD